MFWQNSLSNVLLLSLRLLIFYMRVPGTSFYSSTLVMLNLALIVAFVYHIQIMKLSDINEGTFSFLRTQQTSIIWPDDPRTEGACERLMGD